MNTETTNIIKFGSGDPRIVILIAALEEVVYEHGKGLQFATIIGAVDMLKLQLFENQREEI